MQRRRVIEQRLKSAAEAARKLGFAVTYWSPEEVGDACPEELIDRAVMRGNDYLLEVNDDA